MVAVKNSSHTLCLGERIILVQEEHRDTSVKANTCKFSL